MFPRKRLRAPALVAFLAALAFPCATSAANADADAGVDQTGESNVPAAREHFEKARTYYGQGAYREAIAELEAAHALDPSAKDLVFNLGVVHEKLADIDDALTWFRLFTTMELTSQEREKADAYIKRLEGAKKELEQAQASQRTFAAAGSQRTGGSPTSPPPTSAFVAGRFDELTIGGLGVTGAGLLVGIVMGIKAKADDPSSGFITGVNGSYSDLINNHNAAHREAIIADVGFGIAAAGALATAYLYFGRSRSAGRPATGSTTVSAAPLYGGSALLVQGSF